MKRLIGLFALFMVSTLSIAQFDYTAIYKTTTSEGSSKYIRVYDDGLVLLFSSEEGIEVVKGKFTREKAAKNATILSAQSIVKDGTKASFVVVEDTKKINCIAHSVGNEVTLLMLTAGAPKVELVYTKIH